MTSKERVRAVMRRERPDRTPAAFEAVGSVKERLLAHYGYHDEAQLRERYGVDIVYAAPKYIGPALETYRNEKGETVRRSFWGYEETLHTTAVDTYATTTFFPLEGVETPGQLESCVFPSADWFDYTPIAQVCGENPDKAVVIGHEGPFQIVTYLMRMEEFFVLMVESPQLVHAILGKIHAFEMEYYTRMFEAGQGRVDILRTHDDYGTQISLLFSVDMWREFFAEHTRELAALAHRFGAFFQQHSCGAVGPLIPELIACGVDSLEPLQKVRGLEPDVLAERFAGKITFHGGIDTQDLLPHGTPEQVRAEAERYVRTLGRAPGGYILMASQCFEGDVPVENIEAVYAASRQP